MFKKYKKFKRKRFLKRYLYQSLESDDVLEVRQVDGLLPLLSCYIKHRGVCNFVRLLDEETYIGVWSALLEFQDKYPQFFEYYKEVDEQ